MNVEVNILDNQTSAKLNSSWAKDVKPFADLILERIRIASKMRISWLQHVWADFRDSENSQWPTNPELQGYLDNIDDAELEDSWKANDPTIIELGLLLRQIERRLNNDSFNRINSIKKIFDLSEAESDILQSCLALSIDPNLGHVFSFLQDTSYRNYVTLPLVSRLFGHKKWYTLSPASSLLTWGLVRETIIGKGEPGMFELDPQIRNWLLGIDGVNPLLQNASAILFPVIPLTNWPVAEVAATIKAHQSKPFYSPLRILLSGNKGTGRSGFAAAVSSSLNKNLLVINTDRYPQESLRLVFQHANRDAWLFQTAILWKGTLVNRLDWNGCSPVFPIQFISIEKDQQLETQAGYIDHQVDIPSMIPQDAGRLLLKWVPSSCHWPAEDFAKISGRTGLTVSRLKSLAGSGVQNWDEARQILRSFARIQIGELAQSIDCPFNWDDLVVPPSVMQQLDDFQFEATQHESFWKDPMRQRLFPQGRGLFGLFSGPPGTGKTMAAQVLAGSLGLDLFRIDLSAIVSKYVGETSKNIEQILSRAKTLGVILLFDEADALFGKRTELKDAHDRFANTDTNYLLQAIEDYPGIAILASNKKGNMDGGFMRRIRHVVEFPKPDREHRFILWKKLIEQLSPTAPSEKMISSLKELSSVIEVTGSQIKMAVLSALFLSQHDGQPLSVHHLLRGLEKELAKEDRGMGEYGLALFKKEMV